MHYSSSIVDVKPSISSVASHEQSMLVNVIDEHIRVHSQDQALMQSVENDNGTLFQSSTLSSQANPAIPNEDDEDFQAYARQHSYTVAYQCFPYENLGAEQEIIDYLLKRVVLMREMPLVTATKNLEFAKDLKLN